MSGAAEAQTLYGYDGTSVAEFVGPPAPPLGYPAGPMVTVFPAFVPAAFPTPAPVPPPPAFVGDIAVDKATDTVWVTNGIVVTEYSPVGVPVSGFVVPPGMFMPGPILGMGIDSTAGLIWITDGAMAMAIVPPPVFPGFPIVMVPPFPLPPGPPKTDIDWDPMTGTLWVCDLGGAVTNVLVGGAMIGAFPVPPPLAPGLQGVTVDTTAGMIYVTDGLLVARFMPGGALAPVTFYTPIPFFPSGPPTLGLAFALRGTPYGVGAAVGVPPTFRCGQSSTPGTLTLSLSGAAPLSAHTLLLSSGPLGPAPIVFVGPVAVPILVSLFPPVITAPIFAVGAAGTASVALALPPGLPLGAVLTMQSIGVDPLLGTIEATNGLRVTFGLP